MIWSLSLSVIIHLLYFLGVMAFGYYQTVTYMPDILASYENTNYLQNEVAFGVVGNPLIYFVTFFFLTIVCFAILFGLKKRSSYGSV
ncbi:hypothetical protein LQ50_07475 [Halalkalibacter okhensis]|uniref:Uncharacterized protein n=2 Tax=Halalkalibacter okhensis TaxID=333138 RepID=A0A0B0IIC7_9BACI|nr:hypothetical protein LQ50_07475 [Halalkalibacter okhensis]